MLRRWLLHPVEALALSLVLLLLRVLPLDWASGLGGAVARAIGPRLPVSDQARQNLRRALPALDAAAVERVVRGVWDNLGRVVGEYPHLRRIGATRVELIGIEHFQALRDDGAPGICFTGHIGNWELLPVMAARHGVRLSTVYRAANNRYVDRLLRILRSDAAELIPKGSAGARQMIAALGRGGHLGMLVDQKMNDGIEAGFFGRPAMTAPALAQLALKYDCPVLPARVERIGGARFRVIVEPPLALARSGDRAADTRALTETVNRHLERWIADKPEQWLWLHRRWPD
ncbi:MAG: lipid A biosynthesis lauroyl acyltransferase [Proteobacteria bacterium]|nr:lipid A biosynthesis lauroyl acyltransferase [Pseudomonadota bacterium]